MVIEIAYHLFCQESFAKFTIAFKILQLIAQTLQMTSKQTKNQFASLKHDLELIRCQTDQNIDESIPRTCRSNVELSKILAMKNNQVYFKEIKHKIGKTLNSDACEFFSGEQSIDAFKIHVHEERQKMIHDLMIRDKGQEKSKESSALNLLKSFTSSSQQNTTKMPLFQCLGILGAKQQIQACKQFRISNELNSENVEDLAECFKHIINVSQDIKYASTREKQKAKIDNISLYKQFFQSVIQKRDHSQDRSINLMTYIDSFRTNSSFQKLFSQGQFFLLAYNTIKSHTEVSLSQPQKNILTEYQRIFKTIDIFIKDDSKQKRFMTQNLNEDDFWEKICYLYSRGPEFYYMLHYHLKYKEQLQLLRHFNALMEGLQSNYQPNTIQLQSNKYYRQFIMLLECNYLNYCLENQKRQEQYLIYIALRESQLLSHQNKSNQSQIKFLKQAASKMLHQFKTSLLLNKEKHSIQTQMIKLFALGQYTSTFSLLYQNKKLSLIEYIIALAILNDIDIKHSTILLYDHHKTIKESKKLFQNAIHLPQSYELQEYYLMIAALLPSFSLSEDNKQYIIDLIVSNNIFFQHLCEFIGFQTFLKKLGLSIQEISKILQFSINRHKNYAYCLQLALSSSIYLLQLPKLLSKDSNGKRKPSEKATTNYRSSILLYNIGKRYNQFQNPSLNILQGASTAFFENKAQRFNLLIEGFCILIKSNLLLLRDPELRQQKYEEIAYINNLYKQLSSTEVKKQMYSYLQMKDSEEIKHANQQIISHTNMLIFTFNMLKIKNSIKNRQFEYIVDVLNSIFEEMSQFFKSTVTNLEKLYDNRQIIKNSLFNFIGDIIQSILFLNECKKKVIQRNRSILHYVCKEVHTFLSELKGKQAEGNILFRQLEKIMSQLNYF